MILCPERSGSTLLATALGAHPLVVAPPELHLLRFPTVAAWAEGYPAARASLTDLLPRLDPPADLPGFLDRFGASSPTDAYPWLLAGLGPGRILVDKTPAYARETAALPAMERLSPYYLWLVRHPLGVAASRARRFRERRRAANTTLGARVAWPLYRLRWWWRWRSGRWARWETDYWSDAHEAIRDHLSGVPEERRLRLHFERLLAHPERELRRVCDRLGIAFDPEMLRPGAHRSERLAWGVGDESGRDREGFDPRAADRWRDSLREDMASPRALALLQELSDG